MRQLVLNAEVYLATTQEVDSLSVKEAMGAGVPVLGYAWGGTAEVVRHKIEGYLVEPGDIDGLMEGLEWIRSNRDACSKAARARAQEYAWPKIIERYANLYREVYERKSKQSKQQSSLATTTMHIILPRRSKVYWRKPTSLTKLLSLTTVQLTMPHENCTRFR
jgi:hypothetical protein